MVGWKYVGLVAVLALSFDAALPSVADACGAGLKARTGRARKGPVGRVVIAAGPDKAPMAAKPLPIKPEPFKPPPIKPQITTPPMHEDEAPVVDETALDAEIYFASNSAEVRETSQLDKAVTWLTGHANVNAVIEGHADPHGSPAANMTLSHSRADAVKDYFTAKGIDGARLDVKAFGDTQLRYGQSDGRNRRVRIHPQ